MSFEDPIAELKIIDPGVTYFIEGSIVPLYLCTSGENYIVEEYQKGNPCTHYISDLVQDGIDFLIKPVGGFSS